MGIKEVKAKSILRTQNKIESWFLSYYGMNLYRGCSHNCVYCDGRSEKYRVDGEFGEDVAVKINAVDVLRRELNFKRKHGSSKKGYILVGGGVGDSYQPAENKYRLTRKALELLTVYDYPVHVLTKSTLVKRDFDLLKKINDKKRVIVSFSFSSADDKISKVFEPGVPPPSERLEVMRFFKENGIAIGMFLLPVIPFITDKPDVMHETVRKASDVGVDFIIFGGMTLKDGKQKDYFFRTLQRSYPELVVDYHNIYKDDKWGNAVGEYYDSINQIFYAITKEYKIPRRIPPYLYSDILSENDLVIVILEHIDYLLKLQGKKSSYGFAAYSISKLKQPLSSMKNDLQSINGVGKVTDGIIREILNTGRSSYYEKLLIG
ncbi:MAG: radical SAM protein [Candidatus Thermoplasmatota archaeon]|jgi:DNA repair photolyase|nr:radical SAM protein [Candidatus Thermoplasmatota archaeon]